MLVFVLIVMVGVLVLYVCKMIEHFPSECIDPYLRQQIKEKGLVHYTNHESAKEIIAEQELKSKKIPTSIIERDLVWMMTNEPSIRKEQIKLVKKWKRSRDTIIYISGITDEQIDGMRIRREKKNNLLITVVCEKSLKAQMKSQGIKELINEGTRRRES